MEVVSEKKIISSLPVFPKGFTRNKVKLVHGGREYFDLLKELIDRATDTIHLQTYIYEDDETGKQIADSLIEAVKRGVKVYLLADGYASQGLSQAFIDHLRQNGIHFRFFEPIFRSKNFYFGRRLHHKIFVVDTKFAVVGGINISNKYNDWNSHPPWLDFAIYAEGEIARELCVLCHKTWKGFPSTMGITACEMQKIVFQPDPGETSLVRMRRNDWVRRKNQITASYTQMLRHAKTEITILCSYFLPGREIRNQMIAAAKRGVKVSIIMAGRSDVPLSKQAERFIYRELLENNILIYEYQKAVLHGKITVCDQEWFTIGSFNVNNISAYASVELNLDVYDPVFARQVSVMLLSIAEKDCIRITRQWVEMKTNPLVKFARWASYEIVRFLFYIFTFYFKQKA